MLKSTVERSRAYFERQITFGRRVVFSWHKSTRWPDLTHNARRGIQPDSRIAYWANDTSLDQDIIEGIEFPTERLAQSFDLDSSSKEWQIFDSWDDAEAWVRR